mgnify:CR=1 FL=1
MKPYELYIFDWDGTLVDSQKKIVDCLCGAATELDRNLKRDEARGIIGLSLVVAVGRLFPDMSSEEIAEYIEIYKKHFWSYPADSELFEGVEPLLQQLNQDPSLFVAVATGKSRAGLEREMDEFDLRKYFHVTRTADETCSKPDPLMLHEILEYTAVAPTRALMVGDTDFDILMGKAAGVDTLALRCGVHDEDRLKSAKPHAMLNSVADLKEWLSV